MQLPASWKTRATAEAAGAMAGNGDAAVLLQRRADGEDPVAGARADGLSDRLVGRLERVQLGGLPAARLLAQTREGGLLDLTWIAHRHRICRVVGICEVSERGRYARLLEQAATSVRPLRPEDRERILETRLRIRPTREGETVAEFLSRNESTWSPARAAVANGVTVAMRLEADWPAKVAVQQRHSRVE